MKRYCGSEQSGRSMVEMLGVLAIIGVLSVGGIAGYSKAMAKFKTNQTLDQISMLITNIRTLFANQIDFSGATTANIIALNLYSPEMIGSDGKTLVNPFNGAVTVASADNNRAFSVAYDGVDKSSCTTIAMADWGGAISSGLISMAINEVNFSWTAAAAANKLPITIAGAAAGCSKDVNKITWTYR